MWQTKPILMCRRNLLGEHNELHKHTKNFQIKYFTKCCGREVIGEVIDNIGMCPECHEWSGVDAIVSNLSHK